jgi:hypothetical protein
MFVTRKSPVIGCPASVSLRFGTSGGISSMWLAETTRPRPEELDAIEKFLERRPMGFGGSLQPSQTPKDSQADANPAGT